MAVLVPSLELLVRAQAGDAAALGRLLSRVEAESDEARAALAEGYRSAGKAHVVGITGVPGSGKSTLVGKLVPLLRQTGSRVAVLAIDPSSPHSGGSMLGDRIRMGDVAGDPGVFIRSMALRGASGGLAASALAAADILDASGFDIILIETAGVGQAEVDIACGSHTTVVVSAPGLGDEVQALKAGLLEVADIHVVSKCDRPEAAGTLADLRAMLELTAPREAAPVWRVPLIGTSAQNGEGIGELAAALAEHRSAQRSSPLGEARLRRMAQYRALKCAEGLLCRRFAPARHPELAAMVERISRREIDPYTAGEWLLNFITGRRL